jgi:TatD DNase family protein
MKNIFDSHAHYDDEAFDADRDVILSALPSHGICGVINCASSAKSCSDSMLLSSRYDFVWAAYGSPCTPQVKMVNLFFTTHLSPFYNQKNVLPSEKSAWIITMIFLPRDVQKKYLLRAQLELAVELGCRSSSMIVKRMRIPSRP